MAYTAKNYLDLEGLTRFKNNLEDDMADIIDSALDTVQVDLQYNNNDNHALTLKVGTGAGDPDTILTADTVVTEDSSNLVTSGAVYTVIGDIETLLAAI